MAHSKSIRNKKTLLIAGYALQLIPFAFCANHIWLGSGAAVIGLALVLQLARR